MRPVRGEHQLPAIALAVGAALFLGGCTHTEHSPEPGICTFTIQKTSRGEYANGKCAKASRPGDFVIRSTVKRSDDEQEYLKRARAAGQRFNCELIRTGTSRDKIHYRVQNCRR